LQGSKNKKGELLVKLSQKPGLVRSEVGYDVDFRNQTWEAQKQKKNKYGLSFGIDKKELIAKGKRGHTNGKETRREKFSLHSENEKESPPQLQAQEKPQTTEKRPRNISRIRTSDVKGEKGGGGGGGIKTL